MERLISPNPRMYAIQSHDEYFFCAGCASDGTQVLMGVLCPRLVGLFFDSSGELLAVRSRDLEFLQPCGVLVDGEPIEGQVQRYDIYDKRIPERLRTWQLEIGFEPMVIRVKRFSVRELGIGIRDYPEHFDDDRSNPDLSAEERDSLRKSIREWDADGQFVLLWGSDFWLNGEGEVVAS